MQNKIKNKGKVPRQVDEVGTGSKHEGKVQVKTRTRSSSRSRGSRMTSRRRALDAIDTQTTLERGMDTGRERQEGESERRGVE